MALEVSKNRVSGPLAAPPISGLQCSPFGVTPCKWRLILDLSSPDDHSVNDGISREQFSLRYNSVDTAITVLMQLGPGVLMVKFDVECAYHNIPNHESERYLLGMRWREQYFVDLTLPFGLRSAPYIFYSVASMVELILRSNYHIRFLFHYLESCSPQVTPRSALSVSPSLGKYLAA